MYSLDNGYDVNTKYWWAFAVVWSRQAFEIGVPLNPNVRRTFVGNEIIDHSDVVGGSAVRDAPTKSLFSISFSTQAGIAETATSGSINVEQVGIGFHCPPIGHYLLNFTISKKMFF